MPIAPFESIVVKKVGETGTDGTTDNDNRTLPVYIGGQNFTIILVDSDASVQNNVKVQVNNSNSIDPHKAHHAVHPQALANESQLNVLVNRGAIGPFDDPLKESSASAADFAANWVDMPGGAVIDSTNAYVGSGAWRWIRLSSGSELDDSLSGYVFGAQYQGFTN